MYINDLKQIIDCLHECGDPHTKLKNIIHIAGTNGKGSTSNVIASILRQAGYSVNLYTSPHLISKNERINLNGTSITDDQLQRLEETYDSILKKHELVFFGRETVLAFLAFIIYPADFTILEVGLGGRLDATNVISTSLVSVITSISYDHMDVLGKTIEDISCEKAGIIKQNGICFVAKQRYNQSLNKILEMAKDKNATLFVAQDDWVTTFASHSDFSYLSKTFKVNYPNIHLSLPGVHQADNASTAISVSLYLANIGYNISEKSIREGIKQTKWRARIEHMPLKNIRFGPHELIVDGCHNYDSVMVLCDYLRGIKGKKVAIFGMLSNKDVKGVAELLRGIFDHVFCVEVPFEKNKVYTAAEISNFLAPHDIDNTVCDKLEEAIEKSMVCHAEFVICFGSLYLAGAMLNLYENNLK